MTTSLDSDLGILPETQRCDEIRQILTAAVADPSRISRALDAALKAIFTLQRRRVRRQGTRGGHCGAISFVQRFGDSLNLNVHFHCVIPDGVFVTEGADLRFEALSAPTDAELDVLLRMIARRLIRLLRPPADVPEPDALDFLESAQHAALSAWQPARNDAPPNRFRRSMDPVSLISGVSPNPGQAQRTRIYPEQGASALALDPVSRRSRPSRAAGRDRTRH